MPVLRMKVKTALDEMNAGDELIVISDHPPAAKDSIGICPDEWICVFSPAN